ncbi:uncharacterized protein LOC106130845 [Amyelois transitella]|uniref:uncharacterized protein LOC106130845 n=1 Tax=Amyelois transitella TaxID=680683 RepID=UPI00298F685C|nr:uncharacterized protein LOC106130845 [Amyelois transitella]
MCKTEVAAKCSPVILRRKVVETRATCVRTSSNLVPPNQYDMPWTKRLQLLYVVRVYWETIPLFTVTGFALAILFYSIYNACVNKVDTVFSTHNRLNISRTMDLRNPSVHKIFIINQRYLPWPEMQDVLDKMVAAEKRALVRAQTCAAP